MCGIRQSHHFGRFISKFKEIRTYQFILSGAPLIGKRLRTHAGENLTLACPTRQKGTPELRRVKSQRLLSFACRYQNGCVKRTFAACQPTSAAGAERKCRHGSLLAAIEGIPENICSSRAFRRLTDTVEKLDFLPRSQFLRQQAGFEKKALRVRQKG